MNRILWDSQKSEKLQRERDISMEEVAELLVNGEFIDILENPSRREQFLFLLDYHGYTHAVPFIINAEENIVLKTVYPSRKFHKRYGKKIQ